MKYLDRLLFRRLRSRAFARLIALRRAWQEVADGPDPDLVTRLSEQVSHVELKLPAWLLRLSGIPLTITDQVEVCLRQYLLAAILYSELQPSLLLAVTRRPTAIAVPVRWRRFLRTKGLNFKSAPSIAKFQWLVVRHGARGLSAIWRILVYSWLGRLNDAPSSAYDVLIQFPKSLFSRGQHDPTQSLIGWYGARADGAPVWLESSVADVVNLPANCQISVSALPRLKGGIAYLRFSAEASRFVAVALTGALIGHWQLLLLLRDLVQLAHARAVGRAALARSYVAENSSWIHRPLFTVWAEREAASRAELLFYSTNCDECLRLQSGLLAPTFLPGYRIMTWSRYLVWDRSQAELVEAWGHDAGRAVVVGPIPLTDSASPIPPLPSRAVAVFDVTPFKTAKLAQLGLIPSYYTGSIASAFLREVHEAISASGGTMVLKQKRDIGRHAHWRYSSESTRLKNCRDVIILDPGIAAHRLIHACDAVICMPFSSPGLFAAGVSVPASFFDPTADVVASQRQRHDLTILRDKQQLIDWLSTHLSSRHAMTAKLISE